MAYLLNSCNLCIESWCISAPSVDRLSCEKIRLPLLIWRLKVTLRSRSSKTCLFVQYLSDNSPAIKFSVLAHFTDHQLHGESLRSQGHEEGSDHHRILWIVYLLNHWTFFFYVYCQVKYIMQNSDLLCRYRSQGVFTTFEKMYLVFSKLPNGKLKHWRWVHHYHRECKWSWHVLALCTRQETTVGGRVGWGVSCCTKWQTILISVFSCAGVEDTPCGKQAYREECRDQPRLWAREPEEIIPPQCVRVRLWGGTRGTWVCAAPSSVSVIKTT